MGGEIVGAVGWFVEVPEDEGFDAVEAALERENGRAKASARE